MCVLSLQQTGIPYKVYSHLMSKTIPDQNGAVTADECMEFKTIIILNSYKKL